jgi:starch synthase
VSLRILIAASEVVGFAKTGGLADVAGSLPRALAERGHDVAIIMPYYRGVRLGKAPTERTDHVVNVPIGARHLACRLYRSVLPHTRVPIYFVDQPEYFDRDDAAAGRGLYQQNMHGGYKADYPDNAERFTFFSRAVLEVMSKLDFVPNVVHANDWQTGLVPVYLNEVFRQRPDFAEVRSIFTIHNIAYQGMFSPDVMRLTNLPGWLFNHAQLEFHGHFNFLKAAIVFADAINTVSRSYSFEIQTPEYGCGLEGLLWQYREKLTGIMNGVDYGSWNPATDPHLPKHYTHDALENKAIVKEELQRRFQLPLEPNRPILGMVARLVTQKGVDLVMSAAPGFLDLGCQMIILGEGDPEYHQELEQFRDRHPNQVGIYLGYNEALAHLIEGGSDLFLMPSRYEPSGLNQLYSMKYGTPPIVRSTGGLADSVVGATEDTLAAGTATGFSFGDYSASSLYNTVKWAVALYRDRPHDFQQVVKHAMKQNWSWDRSAGEYERLYMRVLGR